MLKKNLTQVVGEVNNPANKGKTLFFETSSIEIKHGTITGQWRVSEYFSNSFTLMEYYGQQSPMFIFVPIILYRVEISNLGIVRFVIDSFRD